MKTTITTLLFLFFFVNIQAQERIVKAFTGLKFMLRDDKCFDFLNNYSSEERFGLSKILLTKSKFHSEKHFSEWQLSDITLARKQELRTETNVFTGLTQAIFGERTSKFGFSLAYTSNFLIKEKNKKNQFWLGAGILFSGNYLNVEPLTSQNFPFFQYSSHLDLLVLPRFTRKLNERFMLDIHVPIVMQRLRVDFRTTSNPARPAAEQQSSCSAYDWKPIVEQIRIGVGVFLGKK